MRIEVTGSTDREVADDFERYAREEAEKIMLDIFGDCVQQTPVDTGEAKNSWHVEETPNGFEAYSTSAYMARLNDGWSKQAPSGFIDAIVDRHTR